MVNDANLRHARSESKAEMGDEDSELYDKCFPVEMPIVVPKPDPKVIFARTLRQIETMELKQRARVDLETVTPRGYIFVIHELDSDYVTIGHGGQTHLQSILRKLQVSNPHQLEIVTVLQHHSYNNARELCELIYSGMLMYQTRHKQWFAMENCRRKVAAMFARIDRYENPLIPARSIDTSSQAPTLDRQRSILLA